MASHFREFQRSHGSDYDKSIEEFTEAIRIDLQEVSTYGLRGLAHARMGV